MDSTPVVQLIVIFLVALSVYALAVQLAFWQVPRHRHWVPGAIVSFSGALVAVGVVAQLWPGTPLFGLLLAAGLGGLAFIFAAVKVGTPGSVVLTVDGDLDSGHEDELRREGFEPPYVFPYHLAVEKYGSVIWELRGKKGTTVTIEFPEDNSPFGKNAQGRPRFRFEGTVPGRIVASPTIRPSRGEYKVTIKAPGAASEVVGDPGWAVPRRKD